MLADSFNHWASGEAYVVCCVPKVQTDQGPYLSLKFSSEPISCQQLGKLFPLSPFQNGALPPSAQLPAQASRTHTDVCVGDCRQPVHTHPDQWSSSEGPSNQWKAWEGSDGQNPRLCSSLSSLPAWLLLTICQELFKLSKQLAVTRMLFILMSPESAYLGSQKVKRKYSFSL